MKETFLQYYTDFGEAFTAAGFGQCGPPKILLPTSVEIGGVETVIPGKFAFDCELSLSGLDTALRQIRESVKGMSPGPDISVTLYDRDGHNRIRLYPHNDIEFYLSDVEVAGDAARQQA